MLNYFSTALLYGTPFLALASLVLGLVSLLSRAWSGPTWEYLVVAVLAVLIHILLLREIARRGERLHLAVTWIRKIDIFLGTLPYILASVSTADGKWYALWARRDGDPEREAIQCVQVTTRLLCEIARRTD